VHAGGWIHTAKLAFRDFEFCPFHEGVSYFQPPVTPAVNDRIDDIISLF
jgi:hypothetical protein